MRLIIKLIIKRDGWLIDWKNVTDWEKEKCSNRKIIGEGDKEEGKSSDKDGIKERG